MQDVVTNPPHYQHPSGVECKEIVYALPKWLGDSVKYIWRADSNGNPIEDRRKALEVLNVPDSYKDYTQIASGIADRAEIFEKARQVIKYERYKAKTPRKELVMALRVVTNITQRKTNSDQYINTLLAIYRENVGAGIERLAS